MTTWVRNSDDAGETTIGAVLHTAVNLYYTDSDELGIIKKEGLRFVHDFKHSTGATIAPDGFNTFVGLEAGNLTMGSTATDVAHGSYNTVVGYRALLQNTTGQSNCGVGYRVLQDNTTGDYNCGMGRRALHDNIVGIANNAIGHGAMFTNTSGSYNVAMGYHALYTLNSDRNVGVGHNALFSATTIVDTVALGYHAGYNITTASRCVALGAYALFSNVSGQYNTGVGKDALYSNQDGQQNTGIGYQALYALVSGNANTALGIAALRYYTGGTAASTMANCTGIGNGSRVSGDNQVQLGNASTTTYAYGAVQNRSDERDKADIRDTVLGLDFIMKLRPVDFRWDMRDDYMVLDDDGAVVQILNKDGSKKRSRYHHGLIAQELQQVLQANGIDFGGFQDHSVNGGRDVLTIGYTELIGPLIKAIQELEQRIKALGG